MISNKIKINIFGEGIEIRRLKLDTETYLQWSEVALKKKLALMDLLLDPFFYYHLKNKKYNSLEDLPYERVLGLLDENKNQIEFWFNRKKVFKTSTTELFEEALLFPLFNVKHLPEYFINMQGIYIVQKEIGNLGVYELEVKTANLLLDDFTFETELYQNKKTVSRITYKHQSFKFVKKDTVITHQYGFEVK